MINLLMLTLNDTHRNSVNALLNLFNKIVRNECFNKITLDSIATLMAINLFECSPSPTAPNSALNRQANNQSQQLSSSCASVINNKRFSITSQAEHEICERMNTKLGPALQVLKLLINLQPILFHVMYFTLQTTHWLIVSV